MGKPDFIVSDVHLGAVPQATERAFVEFLREVGRVGGTLLLAGDIFDFWFEYGSVIPGRHFRVLAAIAEVADAGVPVTYVGGNHDAWGGRFLEEEVGVRFHREPFHTTLAGRRALIAHGDGLGKGDLRYRALKAVLRSRPAMVGFRLLHPELGVRIARAVSTTEAHAEDEAAARGRAAFLEEWAGERFREDAELAWVVCGHAHFPALRDFGGGRYYLNAGDWISHFTYITITPDGAPTLHTWRGPPEPPS